MDYTKGIFQSIGFKEFSPYFLLPEEEKNSDKDEKVLEQCVEVLKLVTRRYARKQTKWTVNRFLARKDRQVGILPSNLSAYRAYNITGSPNIRSGHHRRLEMERQSVQSSLQDSREFH